MSEIKPCPFCGGKAEQKNPEEPHGGMVRCVSCGAEAFGPKWNRRCQFDGWDYTQCHCTLVEQDESCPIGYPSLLCEDCDGKGVVKAVKLDGSELWEIVFGIANDVASDITDEQYQQIADAINQVFVNPSHAHLLEETRRQREEIAGLREALKPFAEFDTEDWPDSMRLFEDTPSLTMGHMRAAKNVLSSPSGEEKK
ncbi:hypothetical protein EHH54_34705 [Rhizobium leguminosarum]|uniref:Lar family restriction alleviation protein n=1 Tax=Rhizobium leguminosarum TaxID=384 RepID=UPI000FEC8BD1|nr:Lar family restriction alleviation protein [Rhizobium leguminosarum]RWX26618.1 hypothetical protein EHH54_34705 [Rhizobium leguminosarum]